MSGGRPIGEDDLGAWIDDRLSPERRAEVEAHLIADPGAAARLLREREDRDALRERLAFKAAEPIPARLRVDNILAARRPARRARALAAGLALACFGLGALAGWSARRPQTAPAVAAAPAPAPLADDAILAYATFAPEIAHPVEVAAAQESHLVQWLSRRLGRPLTAPDLRAQGLTLIGGRLLPSAAGPAAQLMYEDAKGARLALYQRAGGEDEPTAFRYEAKGDVAAFTWTDRAFAFALVGRAPRERLLDLANAVYQQAGTR